MRIWLPLLAAACLCACDSQREAPAPDPAQPSTNGVAAAPDPVPSTAVPTATPTRAAPATPAASGEGRVSRYTSLAECRLLRAAPEEAGFAESRCPGPGSYALKLVEADGRHNLMVVADGREHNLRLPSLAGGGFTELGKRVEWRGRETDGGFRPDALILRYAVVEDPDQPGRPTSYLLPVSLSGEPCVVAKLRPGPDQNARARAAADGPRACL